MRGTRGRGSGATARGPWAAAWRRIRRDRWTLAALVALALVIAVSLVGGAIATRIVGHSGQQLFPYAVDDSSLHAVGPWAHVPTTSQTNLDEYGNLLPPPKGSATTLLVLGG